ncbi:hypothetical protein YC2023_032672 [Brassica napus]
MDACCLLSGRGCSRTRAEDGRELSRVRAVLGRMRSSRVRAEDAIRELRTFGLRDLEAIVLITCCEQ